MNNLQKEYELIQEGKGNKDHFLKLARLAFPNHIGVSNTYDQTVSILKGKNLLAENRAGGVVTSGRKDWFKIFEAEVKAMQKETSKEVTDVLDHQFDYKDEKNIDNLYGQAFLSGYYVEMEDPKNEEKTVKELKAIVAKNLANDMNYYVKNSAFGLKIDGYTDEAAGAGKVVEPKGKFKASGYGNM